MVRPHSLSYIQKVACFAFQKIFKVIASPNQLLHATLKGNDEVFFIDLDDLKSIVSAETDVLIVFDDMMKDARYNGTLEILFTKGETKELAL